MLHRLCATCVTLSKLVRACIHAAHNECSNYSTHQVCMRQHLESTLHMREKCHAVTIRPTQSALDSDLDVGYGVLHCLAALCNKLGLQHHGSSKAACSGHSLTGTSTVEVDLVIAILGNYLGSCCKGLWVTAAQLTHYGVLFWREPKEPTKRSYSKAEEGPVADCTLHVDKHP